MPKARSTSGERPRSHSPRRSSKNVSKTRSASGSPIGSGKARAAPFVKIGPGAVDGEEVASPSSLEYSPDDARHVATVGSVPKVNMQPRKLEDSFHQQPSSSSGSGSLASHVQQSNLGVNLDVGQCPLCRRQGFIGDRCLHCEGGPMFGPVQHRLANLTKPVTRPLTMS